MVVFRFSEFFLLRSSSLICIVAIAVFCRPFDLICLFFCLSMVHLYGMCLFRSFLDSRGLFDLFVLGCLNNDFIIACGR